MNIVFVKHKDDQNRQFCFAVSERLAPFVHKGVELLCNTRYGAQAAVAQTGVISGEGAEDLAKQNGATFPLRDVIGLVGSVDMDTITIPPFLKSTIPSGKKIAQRIDELKNFGHFYTRVEIIDGVLHDGYTAYLVCKMLDLKNLPYVMLDHE